MPHRTAGNATRFLLAILLPVIAFIWATGSASAGTAVFAPAVSYPTGSGPRSAAVGDLNADGHPDLAVADVGANTVSVLPNNDIGAVRPRRTTRRVAFHDNGNGTATISGTPAVGSGGVYHLSIRAHKGVSPDATQAFTLTVVSASEPPEAGEPELPATGAPSIPLLTLVAGMLMLSGTGLCVALRRRRDRLIRRNPLLFTTGPDACDRAGSGRLGLSSHVSSAGSRPAESE